MLHVRNVTKTYRRQRDEVRAVEAASLTVKPGEFVAIQGQSGCGKTTLLSMIGGLLAPDSGEIQLGQHDPYRMTPEQRAAYRANEIGFVFQQFHLIPYLSVFDNALVTTVAHPMPDAKNRATALLEEFDLGHRLRHFPSELSTGERQRVALARALLYRPQLILADEPTGNLDPEHAGAVLRHLANFTASGGMVVLVTHDPYAASFAVRSLAMNRGKLSESLAGQSNHPAQP